MKFLMGMCAGAALMGAVWASGYSVEDVGQAAKSTATGVAKSVGETAADIEYEDCKEQFLSTCEFSAKVCQNELRKTCGQDPTPTPPSE